MNKPYICFMTKHYQTTFDDAKKWIEDRNIDYEEIISEYEFWDYLREHKLDDKPIYFVKGQYVP